MGQLYSHLVFRPPAPTYEDYNGRMMYITENKAGIPEVHSTDLIWLRTDLGALITAAWVRKPHSDYVVLFAHSNGDDLGGAMVEAQRISDHLNVSVLAFDYTGYGISEMPRRARLPGCAGPPDTTGPSAPNVPTLSEEDRARAQPSELACYADIQAAYRYLVHTQQIAPDRIILVGRSIGSGPVVHCAAEYPVAGVVLVAPIASAVRVALKRVNVTLPLIDTFANIDKVARIKCPVLVVHGDQDELVPVRHAQLLVEKVRKFGPDVAAVEPLWIPTATHNNVVEDNQSLVFGRCRGFLREIQLAQAAGLTRRVSSSRDCALGAMLSFLLGLPARSPPVSSNPKASMSDGVRAALEPFWKTGRRRMTAPARSSAVADPPFSQPNVSGGVNFFRRKRRRSAPPKPDAPTAREFQLSPKERAVFTSALDSFSDLTLPSIGARSPTSVRTSATVHTPPPQVTTVSDVSGIRKEMPAGVVVDEFSDCAPDEDLCRMLLRSPSTSCEFVSYPVDGNDRMSTSIDTPKRPNRKGPNAYPLMGQRVPPPPAKLTPLTSVVIEAMQISPAR